MVGRKSRNKVIVNESRGYRKSVCMRNSVDDLVDFRSVPDGALASSEHLSLQTKSFPTARLLADRFVMI